MAGTKTPHLLRRNNTGAIAMFLESRANWPDHLTKV